MKMRNIILMTVLVLVILLAGCDLSISSPRPSAGDVSAVQKGVNGETGVQINSPNNVGAALTAGTTQPQTLTLQFGGSHIDQGTLGAFTFRTLKATADTDGAFARNVALTPTSTTLTYSGDDTLIDFVFDMSTAANISSPIELQIDAATLTAANGSKFLDLDGDGIKGEAVEDDFFGYYAVGGAGVTAAGNPRDPRATLNIVGGTELTGAAVGDTTYTYVWNSDSITAAGLSAGYRLYKYNAATNSWDGVSVTITFNSGTSTATITLPAIKAGEIYREEFVNPYDLQETDTTDGFARRASYDQNERVAVINESVPFGADAAFYTGATWALFSDSGTRVNPGSENQSVSFEFDPGVVGTEGIDASTLTADSFKLWNSGTDRYAPWVTVSVTTSDPNQTAFKNDKVTLVLNPAYDGSYYELHIGPTVKFLGDSTAATDDRFMGEWDNVEPGNGTFPYRQFRVHGF